MDAGSDHRVRIFHEHVKRPGLALCVFPVIGNAGEKVRTPNGNDYGRELLRQYRERA
jgi:hypothetical protein